MYSPVTRAKKYVCESVSKFDGLKGFKSISGRLELSGRSDWELEQRVPCQSRFLLSKKDAKTSIHLRWDARSGTEIT